MKTLKGVVIGAGYFSQFHYQAWNDIPDVEIVAACDLNTEKTQTIQQAYQIANFYTDYETMLVLEKPDFVDIITPPQNHLEICRRAADLGISIICQKPLAPSLSEAEELVNYTQKKSVFLMVHENFRFQPWYREIKKLLQKNMLGKLFQLHFRMRMGDGWSEDAYLARQPYFRDMSRLLIYETGIHFIDTFRFLAGEVSWVFAQLRKLNPQIKGEDQGIVYFHFQNQMTGIWDANRYNESNFENPRYTFGELLLEGEKGSLRLYADGRITIQFLGDKELEHIYFHENVGFAGNCVYFTQKHFVESILEGRESETSGKDYLKNLHIQEAIYQSSSQNKPIFLT